MSLPQFEPESAEITEMPLRDRLGQQESLSTYQAPIKEKCRGLGSPYHEGHFKFGACSLEFVSFHTVQIILRDSSIY